MTFSLPFPSSLLKLSNIKRKATGKKCKREDRCCRCFSRELKQQLRGQRERHPKLQIHIIVFNLFNDKGVVVPQK